MKLKELYPLIEDSCPVRIFAEDDTEICEGIVVHDGSFEKFMGLFLEREVIDIDRMYGCSYEDFGEIVPESIGIMITVEGEGK